MNILTIPPTKNPNQKSLDVSDAYLARIVPTWYTPPTFNAEIWRKVVHAQEFATICKDTLISSIMALDWKLTAIDSDLQNELAATIRYYTRLFSSNYADITEYVASDLLDTPFGGMCEIGRDGDKPNGRVRWIEPVDAATLYPTLNLDIPVIQNFNGTQVAFPKYAISRIGMTPRTNIIYKGWYIAPPEKIYMAMQMLSRGDTYYANLLLDIPTTGILDLGDMEKDSALEWVQAYQSLLANGGNGSFKIPVLYEHNNDIKFVPFGKVPNDIMFDKIILKYAAITCAGYGLTLGDVGIQVVSGGGETLAGTIRAERKTKKNGYARLKMKLKTFWEQILPPTIQFSWIDFDDEVNAALGRARLSNATAFSLLKKDGIISPAEIRQQMITDGMFTISMPETPPPDAQPDPTNNTPARPAEIPITKQPVPPSLGGHGDVKKYILEPDDLKLRAVVAQILETVYDEFVDAKNNTSLDDLPIVRLAVSKSILNGDLDSTLHGVTSDWIQFVDDKDRQYVGVVDNLLKKSVLLTLKEVILSDEGIDFSDSGVYDSLLDAVSTRLGNELNNIVATAVQTSIGV